jgi:hypothetical protein
VRLADGERAGVLVLRGERGIQRAVELARRIVGRVQQLGVGTGGKRDGEDAEDRQERDDGVPDQGRRAAQESDTETGRRRGRSSRDGPDKVPSAGKG